MSSPTNIEWATAVWNPVVGCTRVSAGCDACYAVRMTHRLECMGRREYTGLTVLNPKGERHFNGTVRCLRERLPDPIHWRRPRHIFVNSMSDLFHKEVPFEFIDQVLAVVTLCPQHIFQFLTKRPERMAQYLAGRRDTKHHVHEAAQRLCSTETDWTVPGKLDPIDAGTRNWIVPRKTWATFPAFDTGLTWPLTNAWFGTSVENQEQALKRIPAMLACPNAVPWISAEPLLGPIDLAAVPNGSPPNPNCPSGMPTRGLRWVVVGGESGPGARPCHVEWIRGLVGQCREVGCPVFVKQLGANVECERTSAPDAIGYADTRDVAVELKDRKGGDMAEWPEDLRIREVPGAAQ